MKAKLKPYKDVWGSIGGIIIYFKPRKKIRATLTEAPFLFFYYYNQNSD